MLIGSRRVADLGEDPDALGEASRDPPLWKRLVTELSHRQGHVILFGDEPAPVMVDRFEVRRRVGAGGQGVVFEGFDPELGRRVALKVCQRPSANAAAQIEHEARSLAKIAHPNIVAVHEIVRVAVDVILVMEFIEGRTLRQWQRETSPSWPDVIARFADAGRALAALHAAGLEHGDFKPDNVLIDDAGRVRVVDFGIARTSLGETAELGALGGTLPYLAPERLIGRPGGPAADVYAFCVSVWESLYGVRPYVGETEPELVASIEAGELAMAKVVVVVPDALRAVLARGLRPRPSQRTSSMEVLLRALEQACETATSRRARQWRWLGRGIVAGLVVASVGMAAMLTHAPEPSVFESSAVEQTLALAQAEARAGDPDAALQLLEAARSIARRESDHDALRQVAETAARLGEQLAERGYEDPATACWAIAQDALRELGDRESFEHLRKTIDRWPRD